VIRPVALLFDVFGTTVDWFQPVSQEIHEVASSLNIRMDSGHMAVEWRQAYFDGMAATINGETPWRKVDRIHRDALDQLLPRYGMDMLDGPARDRLTNTWHRLRVWPDTIRGLSQLRASYITATLSNGNFDLLIDLNRHNQLQWDCLFCSDMFGHFKPDPETYLGACDYLNLPPESVMMVACHSKDVEAAKSNGLLTAFVHRPEEYGQQKQADIAEPGAFDVVATDFIHLASQLEAMAA
jgi:2-haloacid dehalogenase